MGLRFLLSRQAASAVVAGVLAAAAARAEEPGLPAHLGVASCAGAPCHGSGAPVGKVVLQNEYATWSQRDAHARAFALLRDEPSQRIARNLGLARPAHESPECLGCHADAVPAAQRGERYALEDGVGCEACHGGAEHWLKPHLSGAASHADLVAKGLVATDDPLARAELCLACHFGGPGRFVSHRLLGAGHPRLSFELDTFTEIQPAHFQIDADYRARGKTAAPSAQVWAIGQALRARAALDALLDPERSRAGIWPELALFDCHACHHPMSERRWAPRATTGLQGRPGVPRLDDSSLLMLHHALAALDGEAARALRAGTRELHQALAGAGSPEAAARRLRERVAAALPRLAGWQVRSEQVRSIAASLIDDGLAGEYRDYASAEQAVMALQALAATLHAQGVLDGAALAAAEEDLEQLLAATRDDERYRPAALEPGLRRLGQWLR